MHPHTVLEKLGTFFKSYMTASLSTFASLYPICSKDWKGRVGGVLLCQGQGGLPLRELGSASSLSEKDQTRKYGLRSLSWSTSKIG